MSEIVVWGVCPVGIHVDMEHGEVTRVVVIDEELRYPEDIDTPVMADDFAVATPEYTKPWPDNSRPIAEIVAARYEARQALEIAKANSEWPAWQFGY